MMDSSGTYFNKDQASTQIEPPLARGAAFVSGRDLKLEVEVDGAQTLKSCLNTCEVPDESGMAKGVGYNISIEDQKDDDFNDASISLLCWMTKG